MTFLEKYKTKTLPDKMTPQLEDLLFQEIESMSSSYIKKNND